nr:vitamin B12 ABC transporter permease BtuC [Natronolimnobius sp. AArcel1]
MSWSIGLLALLAVVVIGSAMLGPVRINAITVVQAIANHVATDMYDVPTAHQTIVMDVRLPRIILAATVGFALAAAGTVMQGFFRNPLADPSIIGVSSGAAAGAVAAIAFPALIPFSSVTIPAVIGTIEISPLQVAAFLGAIITAFTVYAIATEGGRTPVATLLLAGVAIQAFLGAMISYMLVHSGDDLREAVVWMMGHLHRSNWGDIAFALPVSLLGVGILSVYTREMNVLLLGEEDAHHLGVNVERTKILLLAVASIVTAAGVAVAGVIGFVGLVVPHIMRLIVGPDHRILLPTSALAGASFLVITDTIARVGLYGLPIVPVGIVTAALGAPFFLYLLTKREVHSL